MHTYFSQQIKASENPIDSLKLWRSGIVAQRNESFESQSAQKACTSRDTEQRRSAWLAPTFSGSGQPSTSAACLVCACAMQAQHWDACRLMKSARCCSGAKYKGIAVGHLRKHIERVQQLEGDVSYGVFLLGFFVLPCCRGIAVAVGTVK